MIQVKTHFYNWKEVDYNTALEYARYLYESITTKSGKEKVDYINNNKLRGISFTEEQLVEQ